jgi:hypothetical protein
VYKYGGRSNVKVNMAGTAVTSPGSKGRTAVYPNPAGTELTLENSNSNLRGTTANLTDVQGRTVMQIVVGEGKQATDIHLLVPGIYYLRFANGSALKLMKY